MSDLDDLANAERTRHRPIPYATPGQRPSSAIPTWLIIGGVMGVALLVVLGFFAFRTVMSVKPVARVTITPPPAPATQATRQSPIDTTAVALVDAYRADADAADRMFKDRRVRMVGTAAELRKDAEGHVYLPVTLAGEMDTITCYFENAEELVDLPHAARVQVIGICMGHLPNGVRLDHCTFDPNSPPSAQ